MGVIGGIVIMEPDHLVLQLPSEEILVLKPQLQNSSTNCGHPTIGTFKTAGNLSSFRGGLVTGTLTRALEEYFEDRSTAKYDKSIKEMRIRTTNLSKILKDKVVEMGFDRTKFIVQVTIGEVSKCPGLKTGVHCLWDAESDDFATVEFENEHIFCFALVFGVKSY